MYQGTEKDWCANLESAIKALSAGNLFIFDTGTLNVSNSVIVQIRLLFVMKKQGYIFLSGCCFQIFKLGPPLLSMCAHTTCRTEFSMDEVAKRWS